MMTRSVVVVVALLASLSGCGVCTLIGCTNSVRFQLGAAAQQFGIDEPVEVRACVGARCVTDTITRLADNGQMSAGTGLLLDPDGSLLLSLSTDVTGPQTVSLRLTKAGSVVLDQTRDGVNFSTVQPNGPACAPTCHVATVSL